MVLSFLLTTVLLFGSESSAWDNSVDPPGVSLQFFIVSSAMSTAPADQFRGEETESHVASGLTRPSCAAWLLVGMCTAVSGPDCAHRDNNPPGKFPVDALLDCLQGRRLPNALGGTRMRGCHSLADDLRSLRVVVRSHIPKKRLSTSRVDIAAFSVSVVLTSCALFGVKLA